MRLTAVAFATIFCASFAQAQQTFDFTNKPSPQGLQEVATVLRTVANLQNLSIDSARATITVTATPDDLATAGWIIHQLDQSTPANSAQYVMPGKSDDVIQVFHLNHISSGTPQQIQEILTILRTVADIQKIFNYTAQSDIVVHGTASQLALTDYIIKAVDVIPGTVTVAATPEFHYSDRTRPNDVVRVFYLANSKSPQQLQEILTTLRTVADIQKIFNYTPLSALTIRGTASDLAASEFIIGKLDLPADAKPAPPSEFNIPGGNVIGVYYTSNLSAKKLVATFTLLRDNLQLTHANMKSVPYTLIYRGTADQIAKAEELIKQKDQPLESSDTRR